MKKKFTAIAELVRSSREKLGYSQYSISHELGYQARGQFISNLERGLCSIPKKDILKLSKILQIPLDDIINAMAEDYLEDLYTYCIDNGVEIGSINESENRRSDEVTLQ